MLGFVFTHDALRFPRAKFAGVDLDVVIPMMGRSGPLALSIARF
jgi:hypothetical protein